MQQKGGLSYAYDIPNISGSFSIRRDGGTVGVLFLARGFGVNVDMVCELLECLSLSERLTQQHL